MLRTIRRINTKSGGGYWSEKERLSVWNKGIPVRGYDSSLFRRDRWGAWMRFTDFGKADISDYSWEIDHIRPVSLGGGDEIENLQALHWRNNRHKGDNYPESEADCLYSAY